MFVFAKNSHPIAPSNVTKDYITQINSNIINSHYYQNNINPLIKDFINNHTLTSMPVNTNSRTIIQNYVNYLVNNPVTLIYNSLSFFFVEKYILIQGTNIILDIHNLYIMLNLIQQ